MKTKKIKSLFQEMIKAVTVSLLIFGMLVVLGPKIATAQARAKILKKIRAGSITNIYLANDAVTAEKIAENAVGWSEIANDSVGSDELASNSVGSSEIIDGSIGSLDIANGAISSADIGDGVIVNGDIADSAAISPSKINFAGSNLSFNSLDLESYMAIGSNASTSSSKILNIAETMSNQSSANYGLYNSIKFNYNPTGNKSDYGGYFYAYTDDVEEGSNTYRLYGLYGGAGVTPGSTVSEVNGIYAYASSFNEGTTNTVNGVNVQVTSSGNGTIIGSAYGYSSYITTSTGSTIQNAYGVEGRVWGGGGSMNTGYALYGKCGGNVSTCYGLYLDVDSSSGTDWGIFEKNAEKNYFSGNVGIGTTAPGAKLEVDGIIKTKERSSATCNETTKGGIYYDSDDNHFYGCNGSNWVQLDNNP